MGLKRGDKFINGVLYAIVTLFMITVLYPFYYVGINSFNGRIDYGSVYLLPDQWSAFYYRLVFMDEQLGPAFVMSILRTAAGILFAVSSAAMAAYALRKPDLKFRNVYFILATITLFFGGGLIPFYMLIKKLMLYDSFLIYFLPGMFNFFYMVILVSVFNDVPQEMEDSARIDGAGHFTVFARIFIPLSVPVIATIALFEGVGQWNAWFDTTYYTKSDHLMTLSAILIRIISSNEMNEILLRMSNINSGERTFNSEGVKYATMMVSTIPILLIYPFVQRYFVKGIRIGAIKG